MSAAAKAEASGLAVVAGLAAGYFAYRKASTAAAPPGPCAGLPPGSTQTLAENISGFLSHPGEDVVLDLAAAYDSITKLTSLGFIQPDLAAEFYSWFNGLTPAQQAAVKITEDGHISCAAAETVQQAGQGAAGLGAAIAAGALAYFAANALLER